MVALSDLKSPNACVNDDAFVGAQSKLSYALQTQRVNYRHRWRPRGLTLLPSCDAVSLALLHGPLRHATKENHPEHLPCVHYARKDGHLYDFHLYHLRRLLYLNRRSTPHLIVCPKRRVVALHIRDCVLDN